MAISAKTLHAVWRGLESHQIIRISVTDGTPRFTFEGRVLGVGTEDLTVLSYNDGGIYRVDAEWVEHVEVR